MVHLFIKIFIDPGPKMKQITQFLMVLSLLVATDFSSANTFLPLPICAPEKLDGTGILNFNDLSGRYIYIDFWASWCVPCRESFSFLNTIKTQFLSKDITVVGIDEDKNIDDANVFLKSTPANFVLVSDKDGACAKALHLQGMPSSYIVTKAGEIVYTHRGFRPSDVKTITDEIHHLID